MAKYLLMVGAGIDIKLCIVVSLLEGDIYRDLHTRSPERTTRLPSRIGLYWEDLGHRTMRLFFRLRCSFLLESDWICLIASEVPTTAEKATRKVRDWDMTAVLGHASYN